MSEHLERAARMNYAGCCPGCTENHSPEMLRHESRAAFRATLRAYQAPREWTIPELEALHPEALLVNSENRPTPALPAQWWIRDGADLGPLRLVYNPDDLKEEA